MKVSVERSSYGEIALAAAKLARVPMELVELSDWWRSDLVLVEPGSPVLSAIESRPELWAPAVIGIGQALGNSGRLWSWAWIEEGEGAATALSWHLPRAHRRGLLRRDLRRSLAHDLRSPLGVVSGYCELLGEELLGPLAPKQSKAVETIAEQSKRLLTGLEQLASRLMAPDLNSD